MILETARQLADQVLDVLRPFCVRCEVAGSVRRRKAMPKDVEVVYILRPGADLIGWADAVKQWPRVKGNAASLYTQRTLPNGAKLDLFRATIENWGLIFAIRTGSAEFSHRVLARSWVRCGYHSAAGMLRNAHDETIPVFEERDLFDLIGVDWVEPEKRS